MRNHKPIDLRLLAAVVFFTHASMLRGGIMICPLDVAVRSYETLLDSTPKEQRRSRTQVIFMEHAKNLKLCLTNETKPRPFRSCVLKAAKGVSDEVWQHSKPSPACQ